jgi:hypothetical protein
MPEGINFAGVGEPEEWTPAPSGEYILELVDAEDTVTKGGKAPGSPMSKLKFEIVDCEGDLEKYNGRTVYFNALYDENSLPVTKKMLQAFGIEIDEDKPMDWDWDQILGLRLNVKLRSVGARKDKNDPTREYPPKNEISRFLVEDSEG